MYNGAVSHALFQPLKIRSVTLKNRILVSPMCQYSSIDGMASDWHLVHLGSRAVGGAALVMVEATAVSDIGRISPQDMGLYNDKQIEPLKRIADFVSAQDCLPAIQLAHAGRKAGTERPWEGGAPLAVKDSWQAVGASPIAFAEGYQTPKELTLDEIAGVIEQFKKAALRALEARFKVIEIHCAHGYLLHSFLSPLSNHRSDQFGGSLENRSRLLMQVVEAVRKEIGESMPLFVRISATDWASEGGFDLKEAIEVCSMLNTKGVDLIDCSSGGTLPKAQIPIAPGFQVPFADAIKKQVGILTGAVGLITQADQAEDIIAMGRADVVLLARQMLRDPYWALDAAKQLGADVIWPSQYLRAAK